MATEKQVNFYNSLCQDLGQAPDDEFENMDSTETSKTISELLEMKKEHRDKFEGKNVHWYDE